MTKLTVAFRNFAKAPKMDRLNKKVAKTVADQSYRKERSYSEAISSPSSCSVTIFSPRGATVPVDHGLLIFEASPSHPDTPYSVGLLYTIDQPVAENSTW